ncbi:MAG: DedA family protein [Candidatus Paceibacterota bacterium]
MDFLAQTILPYILIYKYWALFVLTFLSSLAIPIPAGTLLIASSAFASQGYFNFFIILLVATIASIVGDNICYWVIRLYGRTVFDKFAFTRKILHSENSRLIQKKMKERPGFVIFISRFEAIATLSVNALCAFSEVSYRRYLAFEVLGSIGYVAFYGTLGYVFGDSWEAVNKLVGNFSIIVFVILISAGLLFWKRMLKKLKKEESLTLS